MNLHKHLANRLAIATLACVALLASMAIANAEDGYRLWLRYDAVPQQSLASYRTHVTAIFVPGNSSTLEAIRAELIEGCSGLLNEKVPATDAVRDGAIVVGTPASSPLIAGLKWQG